MPLVAQGKSFSNQHRAREKRKTKEDDEKKREKKSKEIDGWWHVCFRRTFVWLKHCKTNSSFQLTSLAIWCSQISLFCLPCCQSVKGFTLGLNWMPLKKKFRIEHHHHITIDSSREKWKIHFDEKRYTVCCLDMMTVILTYVWICLHFFTPFSFRLQLRAHILDPCFV